MPTVGYLHDGHLALIAASQAKCDVTVVSIFVNPTQFGANEDLSTYLRDFLRDEELCRDLVLRSSSRPMHRKSIRAISKPLLNLATSRNLYAALSGPDIFAVRLSSASCSNMVQPHVAFLGQKDVQQCVVVRRMVVDLNVPIEIVTVPTVREKDGPAMSSRNRYLS
ncbi:pantoate--beta-alanine ligase [Bradyrhizobium diazoefficiens]